MLQFSAALLVAEKAAFKQLKKRNLMNKKQYAASKMKMVPLKRRANLLECSADLNCGEMGYNHSFSDETQPKA